MDNTPDRNQIGTPLSKSKFEDSPVFNYINNLSPIKPVKSLHIAQTFQSLSFASLPSVFTSPHISSHKEYRFLGRHQYPDSSKPQFSSDDGEEDKTSTGVTSTVGRSTCCSPGDQENCEIGISIEEFNVEPPNERSKLSLKLPQSLQYVDCDKFSDATPRFAIKMEMVQASASLVKHSEEKPEERSVSMDTEPELQGECQLDQTKEVDSGCDWENLISDACDDVLIFNSSNESEACDTNDHKTVDLDATSFALLSHVHHDNSDSIHNTQPLGSMNNNLNQDPTIHPGEIENMEQKETDHTPQLLPCVYQNNQEIGDLSEKMDDKAGDCISFGSKVDTQQQRGMRRRCLVFEVAAHKKNLEDDSKSDSSTSMQTEGKYASDDKQLVPFKPGAGSASYVLPGIGLHLNALASTSKDFRAVKRETLTSGSRLISMPASVGSFDSLTAFRQKSLNQSLVPISAQGGFDSTSNAAEVVPVSLQTPAVEIGEEFNQSSPKKKRRRLENAGESEGCKRCNCKKSKCLKLYCECFAAGVYCVEPCSCHDCFNKPVHEDTVLATRKQIESRNPLAFAPKVIRNSESIPEVGDEGNNTPASARHKRGCNCKKSSCLKKYCECYQGGVGCSRNCRCEGCKNAFGRKNGYGPIETEEAEQEDEVSEFAEKDGLDKCQQIEVQEDEKECLDVGLHMTPFQICRSSIKAPFLSSGKPPRPSLVAVGTSPCRNTSLRKSGFLQPQLSLEKNFPVEQKDETPDILRGNCSPIGGVKIASPNRKRVSPPHNEFGLSPGQRRRKLILKSIPSFPSLTPPSHQ